MAWDKVPWKDEKVNWKADQQLSKAARAKEVAKLMSTSVNELLWKVSVKWKVPKINPKMLLLSLSLVGTIWIGWVVYTKFDDIKWKVTEVLSKPEWNKPTYFINEDTPIKWIPKNDWFIYVMYTQKDWERIIVKREYSNYFLDCKIYESKAPNWETVFIYVSRDTIEKEYFPKWSIIEWIKIATIKKESKKEEQKMKYFKSNS